MITIYVVLWDIVCLLYGAYMAKMGVRGKDYYAKGFVIVAVFAFSLISLFKE